MNQQQFNRHSGNDEGLIKTFVQVVRKHPYIFGIAASIAALWVVSALAFGFDNNSPEQRPRAATTTAARSIGTKGPDPISFDLCKDAGPVEVALDGNFSPSASQTEIAQDFGDDVFSDQQKADDAARSCLLGFRAGGW